MDSKARYREEIIVREGRAEGVEGRSQIKEPGWWSKLRDQEDGEVEKSRSSG